MIALDDREHDAVCELVNIASGNAATALAQLLGQRTMISVPKLTFAELEDISTVLGSSGEPNVVISMQILGDVSGCLLLAIPSSRAHELSAQLLRLKEPRTGDFDRNSQSALQETANILGGAYAGALGVVLGGTVMISVPLFGVTPPGDLLSRLGAAPNASTYGLCIETSFTIGADAAACCGHMVLLPGDGALESIISSLNAIGA